jgi:hypothetical protein
MRGGSRSRALGLLRSRVIAAVAGCALLCVLAALAVAAIAGATGPKSNRLDRATLASAYGRLPLSFAPNRGQLDRGALFSARGQGYTLYLSKSSLLLALSSENGHSGALSLSLLGASPTAKLKAQSPLPGRVNYLIGNDSSRWHTGVPTYGRVSYQGLWPGIGAAFYGNQGRLEYDFQVARGADPSRIALSFSGQRALRLASSGALQLSLPGGSVRQLTPYAYQLIAGHRRTVTSRYLLDGESAHIALGPYDHRLPLVIDPTLVYSTYLGGSGSEAGNGIAVGSSGAAYVTGYTGSANFPTKNAFQPKRSGANTDAFVTKLNRSGSALLYSTYLGGTGGDTHLQQNLASGIAVDSSGAAYVTGRTAATDFPTKNAFQPKKAGNTPGGPPPTDYDAFVTKLTPSGSALSYSTYLGGVNNDLAQGIAVDSSRAAYVTGFTESADFPTKNAFQDKKNGNDAAFIAKFTPSGSALSYSTYLGGSSFDEGLGIAVDSSRAAYVTGITESSNFPTKDAFQPTFGGGGEDAFVTKLAPSGSALSYSTYLGGSDFDEGHGIAVDSSRAAYVTGRTASTNFPAKNAFQPKKAGGNTDAFVTKLAPSGSALSYSTYLGGSGEESGNGIAVDSSRVAYVTGGTNSTNFPTKNAFQASFGGVFDAFVTKLARSGSALSYSTYLGGVGEEEGLGIAVDSSSAAYVTGDTNSTNFPTKNAFQSSYGGLVDAFVTKLSPPLKLLRPGVRITSAKISSKHHSAKFTFKAAGASGFQCALVRKPAGKHEKKPKPHFSRCKSPKTYKHLKHGRYTFLVRALSAGTPGTAASKNFKIS